MTEAEYRIYVVEDDMGIAQAVEKSLAAWGFRVQCAKDFGEILQEFAAFAPHLVLMDITLPFFNGYHWCSQIRKASKVPVIFLSSASDKMNIVMAMNMGGDDFISKPFDMEVLIAKVQALLRRTYDFGGKSPILEHRGALLNLADAVLTYRGEQIDLTKNEFRILKTLMEQKGRVVSRDKLMRRLWEDESFVDENTLSVNVNRLRKKLDRAGLEDFIATKVGMGYLLE